jgi:hypothetical protein
VSGKEVLYLLRKGDSSGLHMGPRHIKELELECMAMARGKSLALAYSSTPQFSRQRYMPLRHVLLRMLKGAI